MKIFSRLLHRLKDWIEGIAHKPYATAALFLFAVLESSLLPLSPDFLNIPLSIARPKRAYWYATVCIAGSFVGGILGYYIGYALFETVGAKLVEALGWTEMFQAILLKYEENAWEVLLLAGFTPIPFEVFSFAAGFQQTIPVSTFVVAALFGRMLRFYFIATLLFVFGAKVKELLHKYLERLTFALGVLFVLGILAVKYLF